MSNKLRGEITYPFPNIKGATWDRGIYQRIDSHYVAFNIYTANLAEYLYLSSSKYNEQLHKTQESVSNRLCCVNVQFRWHQVGDEQMMNYQQWS